MTVTFHGSHYSGVSGDTKPTLTASDAGAVFAESNTDQLYVWNGSGWDAALATSTMTLTNKTLTAPDINAGTVDAITSLTVANNVDVGNYTVRANNFLADSHTATRVFFAGTDGVLASDSDFTFATDTLTVTKLGAFEAAGAIDFSDEAMTNVNIDSGDIASGVTINKSPTVTLTGDVTANATAMTNLGNVSLATTVASGAVHAGMLNTDVIASQGTEISSGIADADEMLYSDAGTLKKVGLDTLKTYFASNTGSTSIVTVGDLDAC